MSPASDIPTGIPTDIPTDIPTHIVIPVTYADLFKNGRVPHGVDGGKSLARYIRNYRARVEQAYPGVEVAFFVRDATKYGVQIVCGEGCDVEDVLDTVYDCEADAFVRDAWVTYEDGSVEPERKGG